MSLLIREVKALDKVPVAPDDTRQKIWVERKLSPIKRSSSAKFAALNKFLNNSVSLVLLGCGPFKDYGNTAQARLLKALRLRKRGQFKF